MKTVSFFKNFAVKSMANGIVFVLLFGTTAVVNGQDAYDGGMETLLRGPIHEAFAGVNVYKDEAGMLVNRSVPDPLDEVPPDFIPEGNNVTWIPGYWSWEEERNDFIWVSGVWRDIPPGRQWVPGYWSSYQAGSQYVSGYWTDIDQYETQYLPPPPVQEFAGPNSPQSAPDQIWIEGNWIWYGNRYAWQPGYWAHSRSDLVWISSHYKWTPRGYVFIPGYWDYHMAYRGVMFAPVYYPQANYRQRGHYYTPSIVLNIDALLFSLFIRSSSNQYYFGDYYDSRYESSYYPWYSNRATPYGYDPYYVSYRSQRLREDHGWENNFRQEYDYRRNHQEARPARTFALQASFSSNQTHLSANLMIGKRLNDVVNDRQQPVRFNNLNANRKKEIQTNNRDLRNFKVERKKLEAQPLKDGKPQTHSNITKPVTLKMPVSPIKGKPGKPLEPQGKPQMRPQEPQQMKPQGKPQVRPQEPQQMKPQGKPQVRPQEPQPMKPQGKPQVRPHEPQQMKPQGKPQVRPQEPQQMEPQGKPQVRPQEPQQTKPQGKPQVRPKGKEKKDQIYSEPIPTNTPTRVKLK